MWASWIGDQTQVSCTGWWFLYHWATREAPYTVLTTKHHQGFKNWLSPLSWSWNSENLSLHCVLVNWGVGSSCPEEEHAARDCITLLEWFHPLYLPLRKMASKWQHFSVWEQCQSYMTSLTGRNLTWFGLMESKNVLILTGILQIFFLGSTAIALSRGELVVTDDGVRNTPDIIEDTTRIKVNSDQGGC